MTIIFEDVPTTKRVMVRICDKCLNRSDYSDRCDGCGKDFCDDCQPNMNYWLDALDHEVAYEYCDACWVKGTKYRDKIGILQSDIIVAQDSWNEACKK